ncbi:MAG: DUF4115 domain-containing protein [Dehalococcoidia bacterium]|nr:DUF4115 domain-containing protein [Dehalococcoidia bacterium]
MASLGQRLREAREQRGLSLEQVESSTRIRKSYLVALEEEDYAKLPHPTYVKGFIKSYTALLGLDAREVLDLYPHRDLQPIIAPVAKLERPRLSAGFWIAVVALLVLVTGLAAYLYSGGPSGWLPAALQRGASPANIEEVAPALSPASAAAAPSPRASMSPLFPSPTPTPQRVEVAARAIAKSWIWVVVDSTPVFTGTMEAGQRLTWVGQEKIYMRVGNAGGLDIVYNGQERGVLGSNGQVIDVQWTRDSMSFDINPPLPGPR